MNETPLRDYREGATLRGFLADVFTPASAVQIIIFVFLLGAQWAKLRGVEEQLRILEAQYVRKDVQQERDTQINVKLDIVIERMKLMEERMLDMRMKGNER